MRPNFVIIGLFILAVFIYGLLIETLGRLPTLLVELALIDPLYLIITRRSRR